jgi:hypothetical protein
MSRVNTLESRVDGALAAIAGERMRLDGCVEISVVCVSPRSSRQRLRGVPRRGAELTAVCGGLLCKEQN